MRLNEVMELLDDDGFDIASSDEDCEEPMTLGSDDEYDDIQTEIETDLDQAVSGGVDRDDEETEVSDLNVDDEVTSHEQTVKVDLGKWKLTLNPIIVHRFRENVGPTFQVGNTPVSVFSQMFPDDLLDTIVTQTNRYANECMPGDKFTKWKAVDKAELKAYLGFNMLIGFNMLMGLVHLPELEDYWRTVTSTMHQLHPALPDPGLGTSVATCTLLTILP